MRMPIDLRKEFKEFKEFEETKVRNGETANGRYGERAIRRMGDTAHLSAATDEPVERCLASAFARPAARRVARPKGSPLVERRPGIIAAKKRKEREKIEQKRSLVESCERRNIVAWSGGCRIEKRDSVPGLMQPLVRPAP